MLRRKDLFSEKGIMSARIGLQIFKNVKTVNSADLVVNVGFFVNFLHIPFYQILCRFFAFFILFVFWRYSFYSQSLNLSKTLFREDGCVLLPENSFGNQLLFLLFFEECVQQSVIFVFMSQSICKFYLVFGKREIKLYGLVFGLPNCGSFLIISQIEPIS